MRQRAPDGYAEDVESFSVGQAASLLGVSADTVRRWVDSGQLAGTRTPGGRRMIAGDALARHARTVVAAAAPQGGKTASARNHFTGLVTEVTRDTVMAQVEMACGPFRVVSLISREAADELGLKPGVLAVASVKATNVVIELPGR
jgi:molybdopterin-binding protein